MISRKDLMDAVVRPGMNRNPTSGTATLGLIGHHAGGWSRAVTTIVCLALVGATLVACATGEKTLATEANADPTVTTSSAVGSGPPTTVVAFTSTTSTTVAALPACPSSEVLVTANTDKASYGPGEVVKVDVAAQNRSDHACQPADPAIQFRDGAGNSLGGAAVTDMFTMGVPGRPPPTWDPGQTLATSFDWPPRCPPANSSAGCPPGTYTVIASFGA